MRTDSSVPARPNKLGYLIQGSGRVGGFADILTTQGRPLPFFVLDATKGERGEPDTTLEGV